MNIDNFVYDQDTVSTYIPDGHSGTVNRRLISQSKNFHMVLGTLEKGAVAHRHSHPDLEQGVYVVRGGALVEIDGQSKEIAAGGVMFFPVNTPHRIEATGDPITQLVIVYSPPLKAHPSSDS
jgi:quercetin dioxygenase-like cupin family protein